MGGEHEDIAELQGTYDRGYTHFPDKWCWERHKNLEVPEG
jgi:hypothetical protein